MGRYLIIHCITIMLKFSGTERCTAGTRLSQTAQTASHHGYSCCEGILHLDFRLVGCSFICFSLHRLVTSNRQTSTFCTYNELAALHSPSLCLAICSAIKDLWCLGRFSGDTESDPMVCCGRSRSRGASCRYIQISEPPKTFCADTAVSMLFSPTSQARKVQNE